jgi:hypothetical protein
LISIYGYPARLRVVRKMPKKYKGCLGVVEYWEDELLTSPPLIYIKRTNRTESADSLIHEYSHIVDLHRNGYSEDRKYDGHDEKFRDVQYEVHSRFNYEDGATESMDF